MRDRLTADFWGRRQRADEPTENYIEGMASLARRIRLDNPHFLRQAILNGLRPEIQMNVRLQHPKTLEDIAAAIAEAGPVTCGTPAPGTVATGDPTPTPQPDNAGPMRELVAAIKELVMTRPHPATAADHVHDGQDSVTPTTTGAAATTTTPAVVPCCMMIHGPAPYGRGRDARGGRFAPRQGRGRGLQPARDQPQSSTGSQQQLSAYATAFQPNITASDNRLNPMCMNCGFVHNDGECRAAHAACYECNNVGHFARCCPRRLNANQ